MADTSTQRQRRSRAHRRDDHSHCDPLRPCRTGAQEEPDPALWPRPPAAARIDTQEIIDDIAARSAADNSPGAPNCRPTMP